MANYSNEIAHMLDRMYIKLLSQDRAGHYRSALNVRLNLLELMLIKQLGQRGPLRLTDLIQGLEGDRNSIATALGVLSKSKVVRKLPDPSDGRVQIVELTEKGLLVYEAIMDEQRKELDFILREASINEERAILKFVSKIVQIHTDKYQIGK